MTLAFGTLVELKHIDVIQNLQNSSKWVEQL
jgi:hypothetical protein